MTQELNFRGHGTRFDEVLMEPETRKEDNRNRIQIRGLKALKRDQSIRLTPKTDKLSSSLLMEEANIVL